MRIAIPSKGRLRESVLELLAHAGYSSRAFKHKNASAEINDIEFIEMRPRDAAAWLRPVSYTHLTLPTNREV